MTDTATIDRTMGKYPVSIGTSVVLENILGTAESSPRSASDAPFNDYDVLYINLATLARNYVSSYSAAVLMGMTVGSMYTSFLSELILINNIVLEQSDAKLKVIYYQNNYRNIRQTFKRLDVRTTFAIKRQYLIGLETGLCEAIGAINLTTNGYFEMVSTSGILNSNYRRNLLMTHYAPDLLLTSFDKNLIESHTGRIKKPYEFSSKLKKPGSELPFNKYTLQIFGDTSGFINSVSSKVKAEVMRVCREFGVTHVTSTKRFYELMVKYANGETKAIIKQMK